VQIRVNIKDLAKLISLAHNKPNIVYVVSIVSELRHNPVNKILQYLKTSVGRGLLFNRNEK